MQKVLIIEDDKSISDIQRDYLVMSGIEVDCAYDGQSGLDLINSNNYSLVVLDLMLPNIDGMEILKRVGDTKKFPIVVLSAKGDEMYKIKAINLGADDYITKPFSMGEFVARVKGHIKLYEKFNTGQQHKSTVIRGLTIDEEDRRVFVNETEVILTGKEFDLLLFLAHNPNRVFSKEQIFEKIWGYDALSDTTTVTVHVSKIRDKIEADPSKPQYIETVWGIGYRFKV